MFEFIICTVISILIFVFAFELEEGLMSLIGGKGILEVISEWLEKRGK